MEKWKKKFKSANVGLEGEYKCLSKNKFAKICKNILDNIGKLYFTVLKEKKYTNFKNQSPTYTPKCKSRISFWET